jgi:hypothetical protein
MTSIRKLRSKNPKPPPPSTAANYKLRLFITGNTPRSTRSVLNIRSICQKFLLGRYDLEIIDISSLRWPESARLSRRLRSSRNFLSPCGLWWGISPIVSVCFRDWV